MASASNSSDRLKGPGAVPVNRVWFRIRRLLRFRTLGFDGLRLLGYRHGIPKGMVHMIARGDYESPERRAVKAVLRPGDRVLEIGACLGVVSLTAARIVGAGNVYAFEPNPAAAAIARRNYARNRLPVALEEKAVGARAGRLELAIGEGSWLGAAIGRRYEGGRIVSVEVAAVAEVVARLRPSVLVMDAEGAEAEILAACPLENIRALIVEFHDAQVGRERLDALRRQLAGSGYARDEGLSAFEADYSTEVWLRARA